jgi:hypothetical protein
VIPVDERGHSRFRAAVESKDIQRARSALAADIVFRSPAVFKPYEGRDAVMALLGVVGTLLLPELEYKWQVQEGDREVLCFASKVGGREVEGVDLLQYGEDGLVHELVVMMRPLSGLIAMRDAMGAALAAAAQSTA